MGGEKVRQNHRYQPRIFHLQPDGLVAVGKGQQQRVAGFFVSSLDQPPKGPVPDEAAIAALVAIEPQS